MVIRDNNNNLRLIFDRPYDQVPTAGINDQLHNYINLITSGHDFKQFEEKLEYQLPYIFNEYPIWDEDVRQELNKAIVIYFIDRQIAYSTWGMFFMQLHNCMNIIMPRYNELVRQHQLFNDKNILGLEDTEDFTEAYEDSKNKDGTQHQNKDTTETLQQTTSNTQNTVSGDEQTQTSDSTQDRTDNSKFWDTPQQPIDEQNMQYATNVTNDKQNIKDNSKNVQETQSHSNQTDEGKRNDSNIGSDIRDGRYHDEEVSRHGITRNNHKYGNNGKQTQQLIKEYRELVLDTFREILNDPMLNEQFQFILAL